MKVDPELPLDEAALFGCAVLTGVGAVVNTGRLMPGQTAAVIGLGGVGLSSVLGAVASGAEKVIAIDLADDKLGLARQIGATHTFNARDPDVVEQVRAATVGRRRFRVRDGGRGAGDGDGVQDHQARRHHHHRRAAAADCGAGVAAGADGRRGADA